MKFGSVCSGIEAASCAWSSLGWKAQFVSEIEPFPSAVLAHHYPDVPNLGDMTKFKEWPDAAIDLLVGGTPCQSFSVAGLRKGLADPRGNLMLTYLAIAAQRAPRWLVWENVPGVLSSNGGRDFGTFLGGLAELGYGFAYRVLDAQYFGVAQRRRRVFVVGHLGDWRPAAAVLFERESMLGNPAPRREARQGVAISPTLRAGGNRTGGDRPPGTDVDTADSLIPVIARALTTSNQRIDAETETLLVANPLRAKHNMAHRADMDTYVAHALRSEGFDASEDGTGLGTPLVPIAFDCMGHSNSHQNGGGHLAVAFAENSRAELRLEGGDGQRTGAISTGGGKPGQGVPMVAFQPGNLARGAGSSPSGSVFPTLKSDHGRGASDQDPHVMVGTAVRRLTPRECERLQGFPDDYTAVTVRKKAAADGPRYKSLGNSMAVPVMAWLGRRIQLVEDTITA